MIDRIVYTWTTYKSRGAARLPFKAWLKFILFGQLTPAAKAWTVDRDGRVHTNSRKVVLRAKTTQSPK